LQSWGQPEVLPVHSAECGSGEGYHQLTPDLVLVELIDPSSGVRLPARSTTPGELVVTHLDRQCGPLVRFCTGLRAVKITEPCACGRTSFRLCPV
jgi:phenylacetate-CoA ligase